MKRVTSECGIEVGILVTSSSQFFQMALQYIMYCHVVMSTAVLLWLLTFGHAKPEVAGTFLFTHPSQLQYELFCVASDLGIVTSERKARLECGKKCMLLNSQIITCSGFTVFDQDKCQICFKTNAADRVVLSNVSDAGQLLVYKTRMYLETLLYLHKYHHI